VGRTRTFEPDEALSAQDELLLAALVATLRGEGVTWLPAVAAYRLPDGRHLTRDVQLRALDLRIFEGIQRQQDLIGPLITGDITIREWQDAMAVELRRAHVQAMALGRGGWDQVTAEDWQRVADRLREQYGYLVGFAQDIEAGELSEAQIRARSAQYEGAIWATFWMGLDVAMGLAGFTEERRELGVAEHCGDCIVWASFDWQPIGSLPEPGERSVCGSNCRCRKVYRSPYRPGDEEFAGW
jgi:hypothetical protein